MERTSAPATHAADDLLDEILPEELDWQDLVHRYPKSALAAAALGGYLLGRSRGVEIVEALSRFASDIVSEGVNELLGREVL